MILLPEKSFTGSTTNTARNNAVKHFNSASSNAQLGNMGKAYEYIGRCLHYIQDVNVPHHAANLLITNLLNGHYAFEKFAHDNINTYLGSYTSMLNAYYTVGEFASVSDLVHLAAEGAYERRIYVNNSLNQSQWPTQAQDCLKSAARYSAMILYKFALLSSVPFYSN